MDEVVFLPNPTAVVARLKGPRKKRYSQRETSVHDVRLGRPEIANHSSFRTGLELEIFDRAFSAAGAGESSTGSVHQHECYKQYSSG